MKFSVYDNASIITYICFILLILGMYICWMTLYSFENEYMMACMLCILTIMYACALFLLATENNLVAGCVVFFAMAFVIAVAATSNFKKADGSQDSNFICMGVTPLLCGIFFSSLGLCMGCYSFATGT